MDAAISQYGYRSRNEFVSSAVDTWIADKLLTENQTVLNEKLSKAITTMSEEQFLRISKSMFRYAVEMELIMRMLSEVLDFTQTSLKKCSAKPYRMFDAQEARFVWMICLNARIHNRFKYYKTERKSMKNIDIELLRKRRKKILELRTKTEQKQNVGICYELILDGKSSPVMACFPVGTESEEAKDKFKYLINGRKS